VFVLKKIHLKETVLDSALLSLAPAVIIFSFISTITPGPNNLLLAHSGAHFGMRKTLPHVIGIRCGMLLIHLSILLGLGKVFDLWPTLHQAFTLLAASYIIYMAIKIAISKRPNQSKKGKPMGFIQAASFQVINPKSWATLVTLGTAFTLSGDLFWPSALMGIILHQIATLPGTFMWITIGKMVAYKLSEPSFHRAFNLIMGALLLASLPMIFMR